MAARLLLGWFAERWSKRAILTAVISIESVSLVCLLLGSWEGSAWVIYLYVFLVGVGDTAGIITWATLGGVFGRRSFATLRGIITFTHTWALVVSPAFVGWWFDHHDSYTIPLQLAILFLVFSALCFALMRKPHRQAT